LDVGARGISTKKLAKHVYNHYCTLFFQPDFREVYRYVQLYLMRHSRSQNDIIEHAERWGHYRLNTRTSPEARQMKLNFDKEREEEEQKDKAVDKPAQDFSLSLFD
jgi:hypothetical protein